VQAAAVDRVSQETTGGNATVSAGR
jgi:hypothetical protein